MEEAFELWPIPDLTVHSGGEGRTSVFYHTITVHIKLFSKYVSEGDSN